MPAATVRSGQYTARSVTVSPPRRTRMARVPLHPVRLSPPPLRTAGGHYREERRASWLELFFDLAFAGAVGQLAGALQDHPSLGSLARFVMLFTPIWWLWVQLSFYADRHESEDAAHRVSFLTAILLCVALAASVPRALSGDTTGFVVAFTLMRGLQLALYARARRHLPATRALYTRYLICFGAGGALWLSSLAAGRRAPICHLGGCAAHRRRGRAGDADTVPPGPGQPLAPGRPVPDLRPDRARRVGGAPDQRGGRSALERAAGRGAGRRAAHAGGSVVGLAQRRRPGCAGQPAGDRPVHRRQPADRGGIAAASAGLHVAILAAHEGGTIGAGPRAALYGGVSVYLLASAILPSRKLTRPARAARLTTSLAAMGLVFMGAIVVPVYLVPALTAVLALGLTAEARLRIKRRRATSARRPAQAPSRASYPVLAAAPGLGPATAGPPQGSES